MSNEDTMRPGLTPALMLALGLALAGCQESLTVTSDAGAALAIEMGVELRLSDTAAVVDGTARVRLSHPSRGLRVYHTTAYEYGGLGSYEPDRVRSEHWFSRFGYALEPVERGDTVVFEYLDFGDVSIAGEALLKATDTPTEAGAPYPVEYVNFILYHGTHYAWRQELSGAEITLVEAPWLPRLRRGDAVALRGTGGPRTAGFDATFAIEPLPALAAIDNGASLSFRTHRPVIDADRDLGLSFEGPVDPATTVFALAPWPEDVADPARRRAATLVGQLPAATDRAVIPVRALDQLLDAAGVEDAGYILYVLRFRDTGDLIPVQRLDTGTSLELGVGQVDEIRVLIRLGR